ncbi:MAG: serine hydrolase domain-containing protein [Vicinamibacterales bacterium]
MRTLHRSFPLVVFVLAVGLADAQSIRTGSPASVGMSADRLARIKPAMQAAVDAKQVGAVETLVARRGVIVHHERVGVEPEAIFRLASMTKPVTSVAIMMLVEEGKLLLSDPVSRFIPAFREMRVLAAPSSTSSGGDDAGTVPARRLITLEDLMTHRSGLVYGFIDRGPVGDLYRKNGVCDAFCSGQTLQQNVELMAKQPLKFQPGSSYEYSLSVDVLGRVVEVVSGRTLEEFFERRIFQPLGMRDTHFNVPASKAARLAPFHALEKGVLRPGSNQWAYAGTTYFSGGAGLAGTTRDYLQFAQMLANGGALDGVRLLSRPTVELMMSSHTQDLGPSAVFPGHGFGYGGWVRESLGRSSRTSSEGTWGWSGIYGTYFWVDRKEQLVTILMHQLSPRNNRLSELFLALAYGAIHD